MRVGRFSSCDYEDRREHEQDAERDFRNRGSFGYDHERYHDNEDRCYRNRFDELKRERYRDEEERED